MTTLDQEITLIRQYLEIFKVRMGKRLTYEIEKTGDCSQISFPPMIIQPLVENAIKYGLEPKEDGGHIIVKCKTDQNHLKITVSDTGIGVDKVNDMMGIGLNNINGRLENIFGDRAILTLTNNKPSGLKVTIEVIL
jgi:sensor histidine kinase YesM